MDLVRTYFAASWEARTWTAIGYLLISLPIAIVLFVYAVTMYALGVGLAVLWVGLLILLAVQASLRPIQSFERGLANALIDACVLPPAPMRVPQGGRVKRALAPFHDVPSWRALGWIAGRIVLAPLGFAVAVVALVVPVSLIAAVVIALAYQTGLLDALGWGTVDAEARAVVDTVTFWVAVGSPVVLVVAHLPAWAVRGMAGVHVVAARGSLGLCDTDIAKAATARAELAEEQVRIDQELHDSIGHMITMNIVQAGAGAHVFDTDPEFARQALRNIEERGRAAMGELDRIIATIRGEQAERAPLPTLADIPRFIDAAREAGMTVDAEVDVVAVPPALGRAAFGIVRESLTNAARHAPGATVRVRVAREDDALGIEVVNGAPVGERVGGGTGRRHGVSGMRDRVTLLGGRTAIGPTADGGYRVMALLPLEAALRTAPVGSPWDDLRVEVDA
ncbi:sensor histidine kinase [Demequina phytophila]|uniref:sensor histidine kinase n=1 Tax=Demequina phytophila TaxID=1638981 RepID=UPI0007809839|nr:sensor domain-containing protein [Demequina phytophila]